MGLLKQIFFLLMLSSTLLGNAQEHPETIVQANLDAYNANDLEKFLSFFSENVQLVNFQDNVITANGIDAIRAIYEPYFKASPKLHSKILKRTVFDNKVIDHEYITGAWGNKPPFELVLIYEVAHDKIIKMTAIRKRK